MYNFSKELRNKFCIKNGEKIKCFKRIITIIYLSSFECQKQVMAYILRIII